MEEVNSGRLVISDEQKAILLTFYENGMISTKREMGSTIRECASQTRLSETQVKNWINNYNSKVSGCRQASRNKTQCLHRRQSGYNLFTSDILKKDGVGGSAKVFRTIGEKWKGLAEECRKEYKKKALEAGDNLPMSTNRERALKIIKNMMKGVAELESLGGQCMVLCSYDGVLYHDESAICEKLIADKDLISSFGSLLHLSDKEKKDVSPKDLQEVFNNKYSILVEKKGQKMPYTRAKQLGIVFQNLPHTLAEEIGLDPRKPHLYGGAQRRKLWLSRDTWKFAISDCIYSQSSSSTSTNSSSSSILTSQTNPTISLVTPIRTITTLSGTITSPANTIITASSNTTSPPAPSIPAADNPTSSPNTMITPFNTIITSPTTFTPSSSLCSPHTSSITSLTKPIVSPSTSITPSSTFFTPSSIHTFPPAAIVTSPSSLVATTTTSLSTSSSLFATPSIAASSSQPVAYSAGRSLLSMSCSTSGTIISKDTRFGMTVPNSDAVMHAVCTICSRQQVHGRDITPGNVVVQVMQILRPGLRPLCPGKFDDDEPVCVGGFYEWPSGHLVLIYCSADCWSV